jgi:hypothetical protein
MKRPLSKMYLELVLLSFLFHSPHSRKIRGCVIVLLSSDLRPDMRTDLGVGQTRTVGGPCRGTCSSSTLRPLTSLPATARSSASLPTGAMQRAAAPSWVELATSILIFRGSKIGGHAFPLNKYLTGGDVAFLHQSTCEYLHKILDRV